MRRRLVSCVHYSWMALRWVEGFRPDVAVINTNFLRRSWAFPMLQRDYPDLYRAAAPEIAAYLEQLDLFVRIRELDQHRRRGDLFARVHGQGFDAAARGGDHGKAGCHDRTRRRDVPGVRQQQRRAGHVQRPEHIAPTLEVAFGSKADSSEMIASTRFGSRP